MRTRNLRNPLGSKDWLPEEVIKQEYVRKNLESLFVKWGYRPIQTPILVNADTLFEGSKKLTAQAFKLIGGEGNILTLRADLTTPIARVTAERFKKEKLPLRFSYVGKVFRYHARKTTNERELYQIGIELIGAKEGYADLECLKILVEGLKKLGFKNHVVFVNHTELWSELFRLFGVLAEKLYKALAQKDLILYRQLVVKSGLPGSQKEFWLKLIDIKGGKNILPELKALFKKVRSIKAKKLISAFRNILNLFDKNVEIDLSLTSDVDYYTGIYFEAISPYLGRSLGSGGRYDKLIGKFGFNVPAVGFSLCLEDLLLALEKQGKKFPELKILKLVKKERNIKQTFKKLERMQKGNKPAALKL